MLYKLCKGWDNSSLLSDGDRSTCLGAGQLCSSVGHSRTGIPCQHRAASFPIPPTEHQQICSRHGCNWKLENAALWYEAPLRELQERIGKKNQKRKVGWLPELLTTVPVSLGGHWGSPVSHARHILSPDFLAGNVRGLHIQAVIQH